MEVIGGKQVLQDRTLTQLHKFEVEYVYLLSTAHKANFKIANLKQEKNLNDV